MISNSLKQKLTKLIILILIILISFCYQLSTAKADAADDAVNAAASGAQDTIDTTVKILQNLTCETQGIGDLLRSEFSHTCIAAPFSTFAIANIVSPILYPNMILRLKINDTELFGIPSDPSAGLNANISSPCARQNRIDYNKQEISFGLCNNILLAEASVKAVANSAVAIASSMLTGTDPWDGIKDAWNIPKSSYHEIHKYAKEGDNGIMFDIGVPVAFPWKVIVDKDRMCVATYGITGLIPVGCKYIKEPFPQSIYSSFMDDPSVISQGKINVVSSTGLISKATDPQALVQCSGVGSCFNKAYSVAKSPIVISSPLIECVKQMATKLLVSDSVCSFDQIDQVINSPQRESSPLFQFQRNMHRAVTAFLSLYVILWGARILLSGNIPPKGEIVTFALKVIFVVYFAVGINITPNSTNDYDRMDGMTQWTFPFLLGGVSQIGNWIMNASPSELCKFFPSDYPSDMAHMAIWDSLDCRVSHYLGLDILSTMLAENQARTHDFTHFDGLSFPIPPYLYLLIPAIISGQTTLISLAVMFPLLIISVSAFMVNATIVCLIGIVILGMLAPLFVPMMLFQYTKGYFESWVRLLLSFMLQPMVIGAFIISMFSVYDFGFYGTCKYIYTPLQSDQRIVKAYFVDNNWDNYPDTDSVTGCKNSLGYMLNNPQGLQTGLTGGPQASSNPITNAANTAIYYKNLIKDPIANIPVLQYLSRFDFLSSLSNPSGMFFDYASVQFQQVKNIILSLVTACLTMYLMYNFSAQLTEFAADMTEGVSLSGSAITPQTIFKYGMKIVGAVGGGASSGASKVAGEGASKVASSIGRAGLKQIASKGAELAKDKISSEAVAQAKDSFSVGGSTSAAGGKESNNADKSENQENSKTTAFLSKEEISKISQSKKDEPKSIIISSQRAQSNVQNNPKENNNISSKGTRDEKNIYLSKEEIAKIAENKKTDPKAAVISQQRSKDTTTRKDSITTIEEKLKNSTLAQDKKKEDKDESS